MLACYRGEAGGDGIHLLGPLAKKVIRIAPPLVLTEAEANDWPRVLANAATTTVAAFARTREHNSGPDYPCSAPGWIG